MAAQTIVPREPRLEASFNSFIVRSRWIREEARVFPPFFPSIRMRDTLPGEYISAAFRDDKIYETREYSSRPANILAS